MRGEITITDDDVDADPTLNSPSVLEGNSATTDLVFEVTLAAPHPALTFNFRTVDGHRRYSRLRRVSRLEDLPRQQRHHSDEDSDHDQGEGRHCSTSSTRR